MPSNHLHLCCPLLSCPQSLFPSIGVFSNESALHIRWPKYWSFSFSISPSNEYSGLISFWMDWLDLLAVHGTRKNLLQHHSLKASILQRSAIFMVQLSHPYMTTGKTIALSTGTFVGKRMSPFFNTQSRFGALGKCKAFSERSFQGKLPGGLLLDSGSGEPGQILRWRASENPQSPGLVTFTLSWGSQRPLLKDLLDYFILCVIGQILDFLLVLKCVEIFIN